MRYFARYIVVCLLLNKDDVVKTLTNSLEELVEEYFITFNPVDKAEWKLVIKEIQIFTNGKNAFVPFDETEKLHNINESFKNIELPLYMQNIKPLLSKALIVGNTFSQIKFSEMTLDMFKIINSLEYEYLYSNDKNKANNFSDLKISESAQTDFKNVADISNINEDLQTEENILSHQKKATPNASNYKIFGEYESSIFPNPQKHMLFRTFISNLITSISCLFKDMDKNLCLLIYISAEMSSEINNIEDPCYQSGIIMGSKKIIEKQTTLSVLNNTENKSVTDSHCLYPGDLISFTRKPLFLIIESSNSNIFSKIPKLFGNPLVILMSPSEIPEEASFNSAASGNLYTLFLHSPIIGFCAVTESSVLSSSSWNMLFAKMYELEDIIYKDLLTSIKDEGALYLFADVFLRRFIIRHVLCYYTLSILTLFSNEKNLPSSKPDFLLSEMVASEVKEHLLETAKHLGVSSYFNQFAENEINEKPQFITFTDDERPNNDNSQLDISQEAIQSNSIPAENSEWWRIHHWIISDVIHGTKAAIVQIP
ncbi:hypothetical protein BB561_002591 [Smittium simulii]|uniref:Uncharacterized protein n=1 Tax=Smittium simulii TaxID=133385 RepID=A0A2T9YPT5_9FUNG|nr:hypothetical protein BB561_002591 [Smittium simulii]